MVKYAIKTVRPKGAQDPGLRMTTLVQFAFSSDHPLGHVCIVYLTSRQDGNIVFNFLFGSQPGPLLKPKATIKLGVHIKKKSKMDKNFSSEH